MPCSFPRRRARRAGPGRLAAIACLAGVALAVDRGARNAAAIRRGAEGVVRLVSISAAILAAVAVLMIITWAALRLGRRAGRSLAEAPGPPEPNMPVPEPAPVMVPVPERLPGRPLFISGAVGRVAAARAVADQEPAADHGKTYRSSM